MAKKQDMNFDKQMLRLQEIVSNLEKDDIDLDASLSLYEEGLKLSKSLKDELDKYESKIKKISEEIDD